MATLKEWYRDFKKKPKWDQLTIVLAVFGLMFGLFLVNWTFNFFNNVIIDQPEFNIKDSSNFGIAYKSPNSPITIIDRSNILEKCDSAIYQIEYTVNFGNFFEKLQHSSGYVYEISNLKYDLFNVKMLLPTNQQLFVPEFKSNTTYIIAYFNKDYSDACLVHKYQIPKDFDEREVCFILNATNIPLTQVSLSFGPKYKEDKNSCFKKVSGDIDIFDYWTPDE